MQMLKALLPMFMLIMLVIGGCARPPLDRLEDVRSIVAHAYASGAAEYAPGEYQLSSSALQAAEQQLKDKDYRRAQRTLDLAQRYSAEALSLTIDIKKKLTQEQTRIAEQKRLEQIERERKLEEERQRRIAQELALKKQQEIEERKRKEAEARKEKLKAAVVEKKKKPEPVPEKPELVDEVEVQVGETLATIAAKPEVYDDPLLWPLIYKANRDQIKDPKEIFVGQDLTIPRDKTKEEINAARQEARALNLF